MNIRWTSFTLVIASLISSSAFGQGFTERGAAVGGIAGALTGAAIGKHNKETAAGALIGGAVGLATGAAIGSAQDADINRVRAQRQQQIAYQVSRAASPEDVITMTRNGLSDSVIISHIQQNGVQRRIEVPDVIAMHQQGVSEVVITSMQRAPLAGSYQPVEVVRPAPAPVIVESYYYPPPRPVYYRPYPYYYHHHHHHHHPHSGASVHFRF